MAAYEEKIEVITRPAGADLSASQFCFVKLNSSGQVVVAGVTDTPIGVLQDKPAAAGRAATVAIGGVTKVRAGGAVTAGNDVTVGASGYAIAYATDAEASMGKALETMASGGIYPLLLQPIGRRA